MLKYYIPEIKSVKPSTSNGSQAIYRNLVVLIVSLVFINLSIGFQSFSKIKTLAPHQLVLEFKIKLFYILQIDLL